METSQLSPILKEMKTRVQPLLKLIDEANTKIEKAKENGYELEINCWTSCGYRPCTNRVELIKFNKDLIKSKGKTISPIFIQRILAKITKELKELEKELYCVDVTGRRPNSEDNLYLEKVWIILTDDDYVHGFYKK